MKNLFLILLFSLLLSCSARKEGNIIGYLLAADTEKSIHDELLERGKGKPAIFYLEFLSDSQYKIHLLDESSEFEITNRKLFVNKEFYPIIFATDYLFYTELRDNYPVISLEKTLSEYSNIKIPNIDERVRNPDIYGMPRKALIIDNSIFWIVDRNGRLVETNSSK